MNLLSSLATEEYEKVKQAITELDVLVTDVENDETAETSEMKKAISEARTHLRDAEKLSNTASYSTCLQMLSDLNILKDAIIKIKLTLSLYAQKRHLKQKLSNDEERIADSKKIPDPSRKFYILEGILAAIGYIIVSYLIANDLSQNEVLLKHKSHADTHWGVLFIIWPLYFAVGLISLPVIFLQFLINLLPGNMNMLDENEILLFTPLKYICLIGLAIFAVSYLLFSIFWKKGAKGFENIQKQIHSFEQKIENMRNELTEIERKIQSGQEQIEAFLTKINFHKQILPGILPPPGN